LKEHFMNQTQRPKLGVTIYSFTPLFHGREFALEGLVHQVAERKLGPGVEVIGFQSFRNFPHLSDETISRFRSLLERHELEPSCLDVNVDVGMRRDRLLTDDELVEYMAAQLRVAGKLGFHTVRIQHPAVRVAKRLVPIAERANVRMGFEVHSPTTVWTSWVVELRELIERLDTPYLGFIPDFGASTRRLGPSLLETYRRRGASEDLLRAIDEKWNANAKQQLEPEAEGRLIGEFEGFARAHGGAGITDGVGVYAVGIFGHMDPKAWAEIIPHVVHVHGKFFYIDESGDEPSIPHEEILRVLVEGGYTGYISSEWEGWHWDDRSDAWTMVEGQQRLMAGILDRLTSAAHAMGGRA
jgi:sugar phosphate isomerase/epimerase